ncbi:MAG: GNAT family N-acetyltransferase [Chitinophagaceae bacterium]|nr:GNAT family N-acetyltransferase [Chitinophagaceae bacterium]
MTTFKRTDSGDTDFQNLVALLDKDLAIRDGTEHAFYNQFNKIDMIRNAIVCYADGKPVGCGAFKRYDDSSVEIKRMYVLPEYRGKSVGLSVVNELEQWAKELHYATCILETGKRQPEAIRLYQKAGYIQIENFGQYKNVENSVCMKKILPA